MPRVTADGGEIGRAQALAGARSPHRDRLRHEPVLLKPESEPAAPGDRPGPPRGTLSARDYFGQRDRFLPGGAR